jgi:hypothetical protein
MAYFLGMVAFFGLIAAQFLAVLAHALQWLEVDWPGSAQDQEGRPESVAEALPEAARPRKLATA